MKLKQRKSERTKIDYKRNTNLKRRYLTWKSCHFTWRNGEGLEYKLLTRKNEI